MAWDFSTDPDFEQKLVWMREFVEREILPLETLGERFRGRDGRAGYLRLVQPLKQQVKDQGLWAAHLPPSLGGAGYGQVKLGLMHEILGRSHLAPYIFGNNAPDSGNTELLALGATERQRKDYLEPLLAGELTSSYSMTEPGAGADPKLMSATARLDGDEWVVDGHKWFITNAALADFHIVMVRTEFGDDVRPHKAFSMILVDSDTPGLEVVRNIPTMAEPDVRDDDYGGHAEVIYRNVRVPESNLIGERGGGFALAQGRLGPGRIHHAMRWVGQSQRAFDMLCERAVSRTAHGSLLRDKQMIQDWVAESYAAMQAARLLTLRAAWRMDRLHDEGRPYSDARLDIGLIKFWGGRVLYDVLDRAIQIHGALGYSSDLPLEYMYRRARAARLYDGPDEVHKVTVARLLMREYEPREVPTEHVPTRRVDAEEKFADLLDQVALNA
ncbi:MULTISPECIES: acyl-CoA dehydrogenase family protein [unclassified Rhodococcus (in: high G+C Gram-positive bacteria)]|uniref:acyl-CoA dehydrogenase family protein n=1 Tax=Rhodococcus sp. SJ-3 TaxID=3454628 RepID=UPI003F79F642